MDERFESDVMDDLAAESPVAQMDGFEADMMEGFEEEGFTDELEGFDEGGEEAFYAEDEFAGDLGDDYADHGDELDAYAALEDAMTDALDAADSDEFLGNVLQGVSRVAGLVRRGAGGARRVAGAVRRGAQTARRVAGAVQRGAQTAGRVAGRVGRVAGQAGRIAGQVGRVAGQVGSVAGRAGASANPMGSLLQSILPLLQQYASQGFDEFDALEDLVDQFSDEELDEALPIIAGVAARGLVQPVLQRAGSALSRPLRQQLVRGTSRAVQTLVRRQGPQAVRALPSIVRSVGQTAARRRLPARALPQAIQRTATQVANSPQLTRRLTGATSPSARSSRGGLPQRLVLRGPVEITITSR